MPTSVGERRIGTIKMATITKIIFCILLLCAVGCNNTKNEEDTEVQVAIHQDTIDWQNFVGNDYMIDDQHSYIGFKIKYFGFSPVRGRFNSFNGTMFYDPASLEQLSLSIFIDVNSINTGNETRDEDLLKGEGWFHASKFPHIVFKSTAISSKNDGAFEMKGDFTMKGITKEITIPFKKPTGISRDFAGNEQVDFKGHYTLNRKDFDVVGGDFWSTVMENGLTQLSDEVEIELELHTRRPDYQQRYAETDSTDIRKQLLTAIKERGFNTVADTLKELKAAKKLSAGALSTIGYTLNAWDMHEEALAIFEKRLALFPEKTATWNQIGIANLYRKKYAEANKNFRMTLQNDSVDSRAMEYLRLIESLKKNQ